MSKGCDHEGLAPKENSRMKKQILDLKSLLKAKVSNTACRCLHLHNYDYPQQSDELANLRSVHDRRLERMRSLKAGYELALDQIKTYESKG